LFDDCEHRIQLYCQQNGALLTHGDQTLLFPKPGLKIATPSAPTAKSVIPGEAVGTTPRVSIIVLNRNGAQLLPVLFESFLRFNTVAVEWIVIDHASGDESLEVLAAYQERLPLRVVALDTNDSFSASCNRGAALARGEFLLFLNNDIVWVQDALPVMFERLRKDETLGALGVKLVKEEAGWLPEVQHLGVRFTRVQDRYWPYEVDPLTDAAQPAYSPAQMPAVTGAVLLCRKRDFDAIGGFDERYFYGYEDVDFCLRLARQLRKSSLCCNDLVAIHRHGYTRLSGREPEVTDRLQHNADYFAERWGLWLKQEMRRRRFTGDRVWFSRPLQAWILVEQHDDAARLARQREGLAELLARWQNQLPWAEWRVVLSTQPWQTIVDADLLLVTSERFDLRQMVHLPPDAICLACTELGADLAAWQKQPWWWRFHGLGTTPLEALLRQLRIGIWLPLPKAALQPRNPHLAAAQALRAKLAAAGAFAAVLAAEELYEAPYLLDVLLYVYLPHQPLPTLLRREVLRILWARVPLKGIGKSERRRFDFTWHVANPSTADAHQLLKQLTALWEERLGYPVYSP
jgi:GT2 family glycosyltransferase